MSRVAVVLFNLGGPNRMESVKPFLLNLFRDPAILRVPFFVRPLLARLIARARVKPASENYALLGGKSPLLELTQDQARSLQTALAARGIDARTFIAMRYWHPFAAEAARAVRAWNPDEIFLLPLYPQFSTTTSGSSFIDWREAAARAGLAKQTTTLCCFYASDAYIEATAAMLRRALGDARAASPAPVRVLFSAHGLPEIIVRQGDPYQYQVETTVRRIVAALDEPGLDHVVCYQSRATPQKWLDPSTEAVIEQAAHDGVAVLVVPVAFVSEHSETLVELDVEYRDLAVKLGVPGYFRAPAQNSDPGFIDALADLIVSARRHGPGLCSFAGDRACPASHTDCPHRTASANAVAAPASLPLRAPLAA
jgi:ferrochelatase